MLYRVAGVCFGTGIFLGAAIIHLNSRRSHALPSEGPTDDDDQPSEALKCCLCGQHLPQSAYTSRQARRHASVRKCRACCESYEETPEITKAKQARKAARAAEAAEAVVAVSAAPKVEATADRSDDPLRLARKAETVLRGRIDRVLLVLENCSDDLNHVAVLRTCEALGVMRVWLIARPTAPSGGATGASTQLDDGSEVRKAASSRASRRFNARAAQRGLDYSPLLGPRQAQIYASHLDVRTFSSTSACIDAVRRDGRTLWVTDLSQEAIPLTSDRAALAAALPERVAVVIGSEGVGISKRMADAADKRIFLPMWGFTESFNISVATALVLTRILDATPESRGELPPDEMDRLRREWYAQLARTDAQREAFAELAERGGAPPLCDTRRPEVHRDEQRGRGGDKRKIWSDGVGDEGVTNGI